MEIKINEYTFKCKEPSYIDEEKAISSIPGNIENHISYLTLRNRKMFIQCITTIYVNDEEKNKEDYIESIPLRIIIAGTQEFVNKTDRVVEDLKKK